VVTYITSQDDRSRPGTPARLPGCGGRLGTIHNAILTQFSLVPTRAGPTRGAGQETRRRSVVSSAPRAGKCATTYRYHTAAVHGEVRTLVAVTVRDSRSSAANPSSSKAPSQVEG